MMPSHLSGWKWQWRHLPSIKWQADPNKQDRTLAPQKQYCQTALPVPHCNSFVWHGIPFSGKRNPLKLIGDLSLTNLRSRISPKWCKWFSHKLQSKEKGKDRIWQCWPLQYLCCHYCSCTFTAMDFSLLSHFPFLICLFICTQNQWKLQTSQVILMSSHKPGLASRTLLQLPSVFSPATQEQPTDLLKSQLTCLNLKSFIQGLPCVISPLFTSPTPHKAFWYTILAKEKENNPCNLTGCAHIVLHTSVTKQPLHPSFRSENRSDVDTNNSVGMRIMTNPRLRQNSLFS